MEIGKKNLWLFIVPADAFCVCVGVSWEGDFTRNTKTERERESERERERERVVTRQALYRVSHAPLALEAIPL